MRKVEKNMFLATSKCMNFGPIAGKPSACSIDGVGSRGEIVVVVVVEVVLVVGRLWW